MHKKRILTSAPALCLVVVGCVATAWAIENRMRDNNESLMAVALSSDDGREFEAGFASDLPEPITAALTERVATTPVGALDLASFQADTLYQAAAVDQQRAMIAFAGRILSSRNRFEEALVLLLDLSAEERSALAASFAFAETLKGLGEDDAALTAYARHISDSPNHQAGHINYAILLMRLDRHSDALGVLDRAVEITSGRRRGKALSLRGIALMEQEQFANAEEAFASSIEFRPGHAQTWRRLAMAQARAGEVRQSEVIETFERARALAPGNSQIERELAEYFLSVGRFDDALEPFRQASRTPQNQGEVLINRSLNLILSERPSAAGNVVRTLKNLSLNRAQTRQVELIDRILSGTPSAVLRRLEGHGQTLELSDREVFLQLLGHLDVGDVVTAQLYAEELERHAVFYQPARFLIARHHARSGQRERARAILTELVANNDQSPIFWLYLGRSEATPQAALAAHRMAHELLPASGRMTIEHAQALNEVGRAEDAIAVLFTFLETQPNEPRALKALAEIHDINQQLDRAEQIYRVIYDLNTDDIDVGQSLADVQIRAGRLEAALVTLDALIELQPALIEIRQRRADTLLRLGRGAQARAEYERVLRLDPNNEIARTAFDAIAG